MDARSIMAGGFAVTAVSLDQTTRITLDRGISRIQTLLTKSTARAHAKLVGYVDAFRVMPVLTLLAMPLLLLLREPAPKAVQTRGQAALDITH